MSFPPPVRCTYCGNDTEVADNGHECTDCNVYLPHDIDPSWTVIDKDCSIGWPGCPLGDGHAGDCEIPS